MKKHEKGILICFVSLVLMVCLLGIKSIFDIKVWVVVPFSLWVVFLYGGILIGMNIKKRK
ncbi:hypothetical protein GCM10025776_20390 [Corallincola platygyrae]